MKYTVTSVRHDYDANESIAVAFVVSSVSAIESSTRYSVPKSQNSISLSVYLVLYSIVIRIERSSKFATTGQIYSSSLEVAGCARAMKCLLRLSLTE